MACVLVPRLARAPRDVRRGYRLFACPRSACGVIRLREYGLRTVGKCYAALPARMLLAWLSLFCVVGSAQPAADLHVDVNLVRVPVLVTDANGAAVRGLRKDQFEVLEDGVPRKVKYLWQESDLPITIGLVAETGSIQQRPAGQPEEPILRFVNRVMGPEDTAFLVTVSQQQRLVTDLTHSVERVRAGIDGLGKRPAAILGEPCAGTGRMAGQGCGCTALWNGVYFSARLKLAPQSGRKALLLLTDGWDTGSDHGLVDAIEASQGADAVIYSLRLPGFWRVDAPPKTKNPFRIVAERQPIFVNPWAHWVAGELAKGRRDLERIAWETGGIAFDGSSGNLDDVFDRIESDLRDQYVLGYTATDNSRHSGYHRIKVRVTRPGLVVRARQGYYRP